ncbi:hypothetical protein [Mucilaginibacter pineti]|uniref:hypothetical protein n=1 Tax=Mucilaginibacter pineti TaxID=1391627 RepID=UPI0013BE93E8|nr:hypothetical protein [Mucilaginibacter pineti]
MFGAYNAITGHFQNVMHHKNDEAKLKSILFVNGFNKTQAAFKLCRAFAKHGRATFEMN